MTYILLSEVVQDYRQAGREFMTDAEWEFEDCELARASGRAWDAVAQFLKAAATERGLGHSTWPHLAQVEWRLADETGNQEIDDLFASALTLHNNYCDRGDRSEATVRRCMDRVRRYLDFLEAVPPPDDLDEKFHDRTRTFHRTRVAEES